MEYGCSTARSSAAPGRTVNGTAGWPKHPYEQTKKHDGSKLRSLIMKKHAPSLSAKLQSALWVPALAALLALTGAGCGATKPGSASFASVTIHGHPAEEIGKVTTQVFQEAGYVGGTMGNQIVFQKEGSP
jgi:hypothetical protein